MSDKIKKFLAKLSSKELATIREALRQIANADLTGLDVKSLKGKSGYIRIRVGRVRIICRQVDDEYEVLHITSRNKKTYKNL